MLYNNNIAAVLLGCLLKNTSLLTNPAYPLDKQDFAPCRLHQIIFVAINRLAAEGGNDLGELEIEECIKTNQKAYGTFVDNNGAEFVNTIRELATLDNMGLYYTKVRKFSLLRELQANGQSVLEWYDEESGNEDKLDAATIPQIMDRIESTASQLRSKYDTHYVRSEIDAGEDTEGLLELFKSRPAFGAMMQSGYVSTLANGWSRGHLLCRAGASGSGKTRCSVADLCAVGATYLWDDEKQEYIKNENYQSPSTYIATEQDIRTEVEPMFLSAISGVEYRSIINGITTQKEEERVLYAGEILRESRVHIVSMPNFTEASLERKIKEQVEQNGIQYCVFDYMEVQSALSAEFKESNAVTPRQDLILLQLASKLKTIAEDNKVGILTGQQLNDSWKQAAYIDDGCLAGGKATKFKLDFGSIIVPTSYLKKSMKKLEPFFNKKRVGFGENRMPLPNICEFIFKGRHSAYGDQLLKLWSYFNKGTFRRYDYFVTNADDEIVNVEKAVLIPNGTSRS